MASQSCLALSLWSNCKSPCQQKPSFPKTFFSISSSKSSFLVPPKQLHALRLSFSPTKRKLYLAILALILNASSFPVISNPLLALQLEKLEKYTDSKQGFTLLIPSFYVQVEKAGATVLFEEVNNASNNVGIVVNPVRLTTLGEFGSPQFVADKLIQAEKRKESTKEVKIIGVAERSGHQGVQVYEFEYEVDSTRGGMKRIFSAAFVANKKLYLLNIVHSDKPESPLDTDTRKMLEDVLHSFDVAYMT